MPTLYSPGPAFVAVAPRGVVVLEPGAAPGLAMRVRELVSEGRGLGGVIEALTEAYGASLTAMPSFAVVLADGDKVRVAVRGAVALQVEWAESPGRSAAPERISGEGVTTWTERVLEGVARVVVSTRSASTSTDASSPRHPSSSELPVADGVVLASTVVWQPATADAVTSPTPAPTPQPEPIPQPEPVPAPEPQPVSAKSTMIDSSSVPSIAHLDTLLPDESTLIPADEEPAAEPEASEQDEALLTTVIRGRELPAAPPLAGDHDGATISLAQARALRGGAAPTTSVPPLAPPRPRSPGQLRVSDGQVVTLDRTVVIGRRPRSTRVSGTDLPRLVAVDSPQQDISRSHVELRVEGDSIVATDLRTTNGTTLLRAGADPVRLHPGEATVVVPGDILDLGDGITVAVEEMP